MNASTAASLQVGTKVRILENNTYDAPLKMDPPMKGEPFAGKIGTVVERLPHENPAYVYVDLGDDLPSTPTSGWAMAPSEIEVA